MSTCIQESGGESSASENNQYSRVCGHDLQGDNLHWPRFQHIGWPQWWVCGRHMIQVTRVGVQR